MAYFRLKDTHPTVEKLNKVFQLMEELGIEIYVGLRTTVTDGDKTYNLMDLEANPGDDRYAIRQFPYGVEYKLVYEKEDDNGNDQV